MKQRLLQAVVLLLACVSAGSLLAGSLQAEEAAPAELPGLGYTQQEQQAGEWGQSPWLDAYAPPPQVRLRRTCGGGAVSAADGTSMADTCPRCCRTHHRQHQQHQQRVSTAPRCSMCS